MKENCCYYVEALSPRGAQLCFEGVYRWRYENPHIRLVDENESIVGLVPVSWAVSFTVVPVDKPRPLTATEVLGGDANAS
jgi:hypothetical protein